jgi:rhodanese-related sulfurtransferase
MPKLRRKLLLTAIAIWGIKVGLTFLIGRSLAFPVVRGVIHLRYPTVEWIKPAELAGWLADTGRTAPVLLDVRTIPEYTVSHLPGAIRLDPEEELPTPVLDLPRSTPIVAYCAVGYRSAVAADRLRKLGFTQVWNLSGSIFQWANENRPLATVADGPARVHPVNWWWGLLLRSGHRADLSH